MNSYIFLTYDYIFLSFPINKNLNIGYITKTQGGIREIVYIGFMLNASYI